jgi:hypothetical protein
LCPSSLSRYYSQGGNARANGKTIMNNKTSEKDFLISVLSEFEIVGKPEDRARKVEDAMEIIHTLLVSRLEEIQQENG